MPHRVAATNRPPVLTTSSPEEPLVVARPGNPVQFQATAVDPDGDPLSYEWRLNDQVVSTATSWTYTPAVGETGFRTVVLYGRDNDPCSEDATQTWRV